MARLWLALALNVVGFALIAYDLLGPHSGWTVIGLIVLIAGVLILRKR